jgi:hypothetical protein
MNTTRKPKCIDHSGSTFDTFLEEESIREEVAAVAIQRVLAWKLGQKSGATCGPRYYED